MTTKSDLENFHVVLVEPEIPPNTGNIARLCAATGAFLHLVGPLGFDLSDKTLKRAGMDYWEHVQWRSWISLTAMREEFQGHRFFLFTTKSKKSYTEVRFLPGDCLVFGRETKGLPEPLLEAHPEECITIPMWNPQIRSLNLASSASIALYEALRQTGRLASTDCKSQK